MAANLWIRKVDHPPHGDRPEKNRHVSRVILFSVLLITIFTLRFRLPNPSSTQMIAADPGSVLQTIERYPTLKSLYSLINPEFLKRDQAVQEIFAVLEKHETGLTRGTIEQLAEVIYEEATRYNHDPKFILALIAAESSFQNWSVSERGAKGLMQLMPYVAESIACELGIEWGGDSTLFDPLLNIRMGVHYLTRLLFDFKDPGLAVTAYNYGPTYVRGVIERKGKVPQHFYEKIVQTYHDLVVSSKTEGYPSTDDVEPTDFLI